MLPSPEVIRRIRYTIALLGNSCPIRNKWRNLPSQNVKYKKQKHQQSGWKPWLLINNFKNSNRWSSRNPEYLQWSNTILNNQSGTHSSGSRRSPSEDVQDGAWAWERAWAQRKTMRVAIAACFDAVNRGAETSIYWNCSVSNVEHPEQLKPKLRFGQDK